MDSGKITLSNDFGKLQEEPTRLDDATGIRYDFNCGCRFKLPKDGLWDVIISNSVTGDVFLHEKMPGGSGFIFPFHYYIPFTMEITDASAGKSFKHTMNLKGEKVAFKIFSEEDTNGIVHHAPISMYDAEEEVIQINVPRNQAVVIMDGENVIGVLATHQIMKGWERKRMSDYILKKLKKGNQNGK